jgi:multiple sugar transport system permease protein
VSLLLALLLNLKLKGMGIFRTLFYLPSVITGVAVAVLWMWVLQPDFGILNYFLSFVGIKGPDWLGDPQWALTSLIMMSVWGSGGSIVIFLAGLQNIPQLLYDASSIDGATKFRQFWTVTLPMITPTIFFNLIMGIIGAFQTFTQGYVMTKGGPLNSTYFYALYIYNKAFQDLQMGYAAALSWVLFAIIAVLSLFVFKSSKSWVYYETERKG